jgi:CRP/FNR family cyclic AMP-dependent transcriptional regulator
MLPQIELTLPKERLDILEDLPRSAIRTYEKGEAIYNSEMPATHLYLVIEGCVKVVRTNADGRDVLLDVYKAEELFGESALVNLPNRLEFAIALEPVRLMAWTLDELYNIIQTRPRLGTSLSQMLAQRLSDCQRRVESLAVDRVDRRLARTLIHLGGKLNKSSEDGYVRISRLKHKLLSDYVVTSRANVTHWMNCFRRQGFLRCSRDYLLLYPDALQQWLDSNGSESRDTNVGKLQPKRIAPDPQPLTSREREVVGLAAEGLKNREIAQRLSISEQTVKNHLQSIFGKLNTSNRRQASWRFARLQENDATGHKRTQKAPVHLELATSPVAGRNNFPGSDLTCTVLSDAQAG